jgi:hypothetical protein
MAAYAVADTPITIIVIANTPALPPTAANILARKPLLLLVGD